MIPTAKNTTANNMNNTKGMIESPFIAFSLS